jgi:predicted kinase
MATVHLICGSTGAGRTTYAMALADRVSGVRFSSDEWMAALFLADQPVQPSVTWAVERMARCEAQMWVVAEQLIARGVDAVFDVGLSKREHRDRFRTRAAQVGAASKLHYLDVDVETRRERVRRRNEEGRAPVSAPLVTDAMFDWLERWFEAPDDDELYGAMIVCS